MNTQPKTGAGRSRFWRQLLEFGRWITEPEELPRGDNGPSTPRLGASPLVWLTSPDQLPNRTGSEFGRRGFIPWFASLDHLPDRSEAPPRKSDFLGWVTARENLPTVSIERTPAPRSFFRWLLTSEPHDRLEIHHSTKEVPPHES